MSAETNNFKRFPKQIQVLMESFEQLNDPRQNRGKRHRLVDVVLMALLAMMSDQSDAEGFQEWGEFNEQWLKQFLELPYGIPSQDTFLRVFAMLDQEAFRLCFLNWVSQLKAAARKGHIAIDGKSLRGSANKVSGDKAIHMVSAWLNGSGLVLGQVATDKKSNEITAIPKLLDLLDIRDCTITIDAMGCQRKIAEAIVGKGGHYVLSVKNNQPTLHEEIAHIFKAALDPKPVNKDMAKPPSFTQNTETDAGHGRIETRTAYYCNDLAWLDCRNNWPGIHGIGMIKRERIIKATGETSNETAYFITSETSMTADKLRQTVRAHWGIENSLHWVLDVTFSEDKYRARKQNAAHNFALVRHVILDLLKSEKVSKRSLVKKRKRCAYDPGYLLQVLSTNG